MATDRWSFWMKDTRSQSKQPNLSQDSRTVLANGKASFTQDMFLSLFCLISILQLLPVSWTVWAVTRYQRFCKPGIFGELLVRASCATSRHHHFDSYRYHMRFVAQSQTQPGSSNGTVPPSCTQDKSTSLSFFQSCLVRNANIMIWGSLETDFIRYKILIVQHLHLALNIVSSS